MTSDEFAEQMMTEYRAALSNTLPDTVDIIDFEKMTFAGPLDQIIIGLLAFSNLLFVKIRMLELQRDGEL